MLSATAAELALHQLDAREHLVRLQLTFYQGNGVGEVSSCTADCRIEDDGGGVKQAEFLIEPGNRCLDDLRRPAVTTVRSVGADGDGIEVRCAGHCRSPR